MRNIFYIVYNFYVCKEIYLFLSIYFRVSHRSINWLELIIASENIKMPLYSGISTNRSLFIMFVLFTQLDIISI